VTFSKRPAIGAVALIVSAGLTMSVAPVGWAAGSPEGRDSDRKSDTQLLLNARDASPQAAVTKRTMDLPSADLAELTRDISNPRKRALSSDPDYWMFDSEYDSPYDSLAYPELGNSAMAVARSTPDVLMTVALASPTVDGTVSRDGGLFSFLDTNNDGQTDFGTMPPKQTMYVGSVYSSPVYRFVGDSLAATGVSARWLMTSSGWSTAYPWRSLGISGVSFSMGLEDADGDTDWSPNTWSTYVQLAGVVGVIPRTSQNVAGAVPSKVKLKKSKRVALPRSTNAGTRISWTSTSKKVCRTSGSTLKLPGRKGVCRIVARATSDPTHYEMTRTYRIRVK
jgi:hypothetical protein